ncbi:alpha-rhamnosidase [Chitinophaga horti]|uniref:Alpha-rhamnosidase n=1 Tax=Chitinophaga horti TaxID=2920382 RepID=A0ABY6J786_9BACT|nr:alpha-rhamnosidase [Chitinophaga horti]UYQ95535.1 alpha-rhamnosidase [Chitinophaga horti]
MKRTFVLFCLIAPLLAALATQGQQARWIWYPGDYDIWLSNKFQNRRTERGTFLPVFWKMDSHYVLMDFHKIIQLQQPEDLDIAVEGEYQVKLDGKLLEGKPDRVTIPAGKHKINIKVFSQATVPAIYVKGKTIVSDSSWLVTFEDKEWIDETGKASDVSATRWLQADFSSFADPDQLPSAYRLPVRPEFARTTQVNGNSRLVDFGKETFGFVVLHGLSGNGKLSIYYGESKEEALSEQRAETLDRLIVNLPGKRDSIMPLSKAFRYVNIVTDNNVSLDSVSMLFEYADIPDKGSFTCNDATINQIYDVAKYTLHLCSREFFIDGIKRDRWIWSGDAYQSNLMNYYLMNDNESVTRTLYALRGKDPVTSHINTIMDYTFYWFLGIYDYYLYTGDKHFMRQNYDRMKSLADYVLGRRNKDGLLAGLPGDWIFIDWAAGLSKEGEVSFEQLLFARSLEALSICADLVGDAEGAVRYKSLAADLKQKLFAIYWNDDKKALVHSRVHGRPTENVTRYANMFAIFFGYFSPEQQQAVKTSVLLNDRIPKITTPYMRFYELEALCAMGEQNYVLNEMKNYWGGMLKLGATSFWEEYDPSKKGVEHYAMYGRDFGKSLCHAWGASPIYLLGKYYLGVKPLTAGYATYVIEPVLGGLQWMQGKVPVPGGEIDLYVSTREVKVKAPFGQGTLRIRSKTKPSGIEVNAVAKAGNWYEIPVAPGRDYVVKYTAMP